MGPFPPIYKGKSQVLGQLHADDQWGQWILHHYGQEHFAPRWERLEKVFAPIKRELLQTELKFITIAGTNGKGEVTHLLSHYLCQSQVGHMAWTSHHILSTRERISINGVFIGGKDFYQYILLAHELLLPLQQQYAQLKLSYYEFLFYVFLLVLKDQQQHHGLQVCLLEVGLGGRLDAVNFFDAHATALTSLSRDHEAILGPGFKRILLEKLGITRRGVLLVSALSSRYLQEIIQCAAQQRGFIWHNLQVQTDFSRNNHAVAYTLYRHTMLQLLSLPSESLVALAAQVPVVYGRGNRWRWRRGGEILFYGSHNIEGLRQLLVKLAQTPATTNNLLLTGALLSFSQRPLAELKTFLQIFQQQQVLPQVSFTNFTHHKGLSCTEWGELWDWLQNKDTIHPHNFSWVDDWRTFLQEKISGQQVHLVAGSYYFVGAVQRFLLEQWCKDEMDVELELNEQSLWQKLFMNKSGDKDVLTTSSNPFSYG